MIKAVIVDDEIRGIRSLQQKLQPFAQIIEITDVFHCPFEAVKHLAVVKPDVLFLDVEMPGMNGFEVLQQLGELNFEVIFITAYNTYTLDALRVSAVDYLLKPVEDDELTAAVDRLQKRIPLKLKPSSLTLPEKNGTMNRLALATAEGIYLIKKAEIVRVEAMSNYSTFYLADSRKIVVSKTLKEYEQVLNDHHFLRINRSVIANLNYAMKYRKGDGGTLEMNDGFEIEVSPQRKEELMLRLFEG
jgi:two-component system LytT family response regulator